MLNDLQKNLVRTQLQASIHNWAVNRARLYAKRIDMSSSNESLSKLQDFELNAHLAYVNFEGFVRGLYNAEHNGNYDTEETFKWLGLDYDIDFDDVFETYHKQAVKELVSNGF